MDANADRCTALCKKGRSEVPFSLTLAWATGRSSSAWALGGVVAAPLGAWVVRHVRPRPALCVVGLLVIALSLRTLLKHFNAI
ncbi:MAG: hypothetical protein WKF61_09050 [Luteimonas sp.]